MKKKYYWIIGFVVIVLIVLFYLIFNSACNYTSFYWKEYNTTKTECDNAQRGSPDQFKWGNETCWVKMRLC
jgi:hypothetical protein